MPETFAALRERDVNTTWREFYDAATDRMYYHNIITNKVTRSTAVTAGAAFTAILTYYLG